MIGVSISTLRRWDNKGYLQSNFITEGGHRRYRLSEITRKERFEYLIVF